MAVKQIGTKPMLPLEPCLSMHALSGAVMLLLSLSISHLDMLL